MEQNIKGVTLLKSEGVSDDEIQQMIEKSVEVQKILKGSFRAENKLLIKAYCQNVVLKGQQEVSAQQVFVFAKEAHGYKAKDCKGIADAVGSARGGLYLLMSRRVKAEKFYTIPDPEKFADWYKKDIPLPKEYYGKQYDEFVMREISKPKSTFFDGRK